MLNDLLLFLFQCLWLLFPAAISNHNASLGSHLAVPRPLKQIFQLLDRPIDLGLKIGGQELFGRNKTFRGFIVAMLTGILLAGLQRYLFSVSGFFRSASLIKYSRVDFVTVGFLMGFGALLGDLVESFIKRRLNHRPGYPWFPWDQLDWIIGSLLLVSLVYIPPVNYIFTVITLYVIVHLFSDRMIERMGIKKKEDVFRPR